MESRLRRSDHSIRARATQVAALAITVGLTVGAPAAMAKKVEISARTTIDITLTRLADGGLAPEVTFSSPNPRCLSEGRFPRWRDGHYSTVGGVLQYRGGTEYFGSPPQAWLSPTSRPTPNTFVWSASWPGSTPTVYHRGANISEPFAGTVAAATGGWFRAYAGSKRFMASPFKVKYRRGETKVKLTCRPATKLVRF